ncbi:Do family serine endopeptidase [Desulfurobacterium sp.]
MNTRQLLKAAVVTTVAAVSFSMPVKAQVNVTPEDYKVALSLQKVIESVAEKVRPAVVDITSVSTVKFQHPAIPPEFRDFFREFGFPMPQFPDMPREFERKSLGSGFIVKVQDGWAYILTNNHVIDKAKKIRVKLYNGDVYTAKVVGADPKTDVALIKIKVGRKKVPVAKLGDSDKIKIGELVIAIGNPYRLDGSVTHGIISAKGRHGLGLNPIENFIQTDAAINPGNSGGPLCDIYGNVIGINTAIVRNAQGLGFAVPINIAKKVMHDLLKYGKVIRGWLGVYIENVSPEVAAKFGIKSGVIVTKVINGSPASKAGLRSGDIIVTYDGEPVKGVSDLQLKVVNTRPGERVKLGIIRNGKRETITVKIGQMPQHEVVADALSTLGLSVQKLTPTLKQKLGIPDNISGLVVTDIKPGSPADDAGLKEGDVIVSAGTEPQNLKPVKDVESFARLVEKAKDNGVLLKVYRNGFSFFVVLKAEE